MEEVGLSEVVLVYQGRFVNAARLVDGALTGACGSGFDLSLAGHA